MQSTIPEVLQGNAPQFERRIGSAEVELLAQARRTTVLVVMAASLTGENFSYLHFAFPYKPSNGEQFDAQIHFNPQTQTVIGKCEIVVLPSGDEHKKEKPYIVRAEVDSDLETHWPTAGDWSTIMAQLSQTFSVAIHPTMYTVVLKDLEQLTTSEFSPPEFVLANS